MAFNLNWSALTSHSAISWNEEARALLTSALNKSTRPPIIAAPIVVTSLNLGSSSPSLSLLEIGDLGTSPSPRFRGIFRLTYAGDASVTLQTRVQINPLSTYLSEAHSFTAPSTVTADAPLEIPMTITLKVWRLSGFVILVAEKEKGVTVVFQNDPLESIKVESSFESVAFIRDYLQKEIEGQIRGLFQEDLPVAIHRLSLKIWNPEYAASLGLFEPGAGAGKEVVEDAEERTEEHWDPFRPASTSSDLDFDCEEEAGPVFAPQNNLLLRTLENSKGTLSMFTPPLQDILHRARASGWARTAGTETPALYDRDVDADTESISSRPSLSSYQSTNSLPSGKQKRKRKHRVVNLRGSKSVGTSAATSEAGDDDAPLPSSPIIEKPAGSVRFRNRTSSIDIDSRPGTWRTLPQATKYMPVFAPSSPTPPSFVLSAPTPSPKPESASKSVPDGKRKDADADVAVEERKEQRLEHPQPIRPLLVARQKYQSAILEKAFRMKLAEEMGRSASGEAPPPAYGGCIREWRSVR